MILAARVASNSNRKGKHMDEEQPQVEPTAHEAKRVGYTQTCEVCDTRQPESTMKRDRCGWHCTDIEACLGRLGADDVADAEGDLPLRATRLRGGTASGRLIRTGKRP